VILRRGGLLGVGVGYTHCAGVPSAAAERKALWIIDNPGERSACGQPHWSKSGLEPASVMAQNAVR